MAKYIYEHKNWTDFSWDYKALNALFGEVRLKQGQIIAQMNSLGFSNKEGANLTALTLSIVKSSEIEGELLDYDQVRSSLARHLGINTAGLIRSNRNVDGIVEMMLDAIQKYEQPLTEERLFSWHASLFPTGYSGLHKIEVGKYRNGEIQIVSGAMGKETIHYEAIPASLVKQEMDRFLEWFNNEKHIDSVLKAAIAHFWFIIIHPFDDGNGRIARAISDLLLAKSENSSERFYSMSNQILLERNYYYSVLKKVQFSSGDITEWMEWFLNCLKRAMSSTQEIIQKMMFKAEFWEITKDISVNERQRFMINKLLDGFEGKLRTSKWAKMTKTSTDTALRDIKDLISKGILQQTEEGGRNINYVLSKMKQN